MLRTRLLTATAAVALFAAGSAFAQTAPNSGAQTPAPGQTVTTPPAAPDSAPPVATPPMAPATASTPAAPAAAAAGQAQTPAAQNTVVDVLRANGQFTTLLAALDAAQLTATLSTQPAISIFAPTDAAFAALPEAERTRLMDPANVNDLRQLLLYHVIVADVNSSQIDGAKGGVETAANSEVQLDGTGDAIKVDNATVTTADIDASNGSVFIIDRVLNPAESQVATGDADEAAAPAPAAAAADVVPPPIDDTVEGPPAPNAPTAADDMDDMTDHMDAMPDESAVTPPAAPMAPAPTAAPTAPMTEAPVAPSTTTTPAPTGVNAPNGEPASSVTTTASPPVPNPTDGQVDDATVPQS